jgi:hypothetical protein
MCPAPAADRQEEAEKEQEVRVSASRKRLALAKEKRFERAYEHLEVGPFRAAFFRPSPAGQACLQMPPFTFVVSALVGQLGLLWCCW